MRLGKIQKEVLGNLAQHNDGVWYRHCGWVWECSAHTEKILDTMVKHGLVKKTKIKAGILARDGYKITQAGRDAA